MQKASYKVALGGIVSSLCLLGMFLTGVMPVLYLALPMLSGALLSIIAKEIGVGWGYLTYFSVSMLSLFFTFDKEAVLIFILLFGHYPVLRVILHKISKQSVRMILKLLIYNICAVLDYYATTFLLGIDSLNKEFGSYLWLVLLLTNFLFLMYDFTLDAVTSLTRRIGLR